MTRENVFDLEFAREVNIGRKICTDDSFLISLLQVKPIFSWSTALRMLSTGEWLFSRGFSIFPRNHPTSDVIFCHWILEVFCVNPMDFVEVAELWNWPQQNVREV